MPSTLTREEWAKAFLRMGGYAVNARTVRMVVAWQRVESSQRRFNPVGVGVKFDKTSWRQGIRSALYTFKKMQGEDQKDGSRYKKARDVLEGKTTTRDDVKDANAFLQALYIPPVGSQAEKSGKWWGDPTPPTRDFTSEAVQAVGDAGQPVATGDPGMIASLSDLENTTVTVVLPDGGSYRSDYERLKRYERIVDSIDANPPAADKTGNRPTWSEVSQRFHEVSAQLGTEHFSGTDRNDAIIQAGKEQAPPDVTNETNDVIYWIEEYEPWSTQSHQPGAHATWDQPPPMPTPQPPPSNDPPSKLALWSDDKIRSDPQPSEQKSKTAPDPEEASSSDGSEGGGGGGTGDGDGDDSKERAKPKPAPQPSRVPPMVVRPRPVPPPFFPRPRPPPPRITPKPKPPKPTPPGDSHKPKPTPPKPVADPLKTGWGVRDQPDVDRGPRDQGTSTGGSGTSTTSKSGKPATSPGPAQWTPQKGAGLLAQIRQSYEEIQRQKEREKQEKQEHDRKQREEVKKDIEQLKKEEERKRKEEEERKKKEEEDAADSAGDGTGASRGDEPGGAEDDGGEPEPFDHRRRRWGYHPEPDPDSDVDEGIQNPMLQLPRSFEDAVTKFELWFADPDPDRPGVGGGKWSGRNRQGIENWGWDYGAEWRKGRRKGGDVDELGGVDRRFSQLNVDESYAPTPEGVDEEGRHRETGDLVDPRNTIRARTMIDAVVRVRTGRIL